MEKISCEIIRDLLPGYVDGVTSEYTNKAVGQHLETCTGCREIYEDMTEDLCPSKEDQIPEPAGIVTFLRKVRGRAFLKGAVIASVICLILGGTAEAYRYAREPVTVPVDAVSSECYQMADGSIYVRIMVDEAYPVTKGWGWDSQMPMTMHAATDQVRYAWLYWLEEHVGLGGGLEYEQVMIIPKEEAEAAQILFTEIIPWDQGKEGASKVLYDRNTRLQPASEEMEQRLKDGKVYHYWLVNIPGYR